MHNALWDPVLFVIDIAEEREVTLGLNSYVFKFDCSFVHEAILNGRPASRAKYDSLLDDVRQFSSSSRLRCLGLWNYIFGRTNEQPSFCPFVYANR